MGPAENEVVWRQQEAKQQVGWWLWERRRRSPIWLHLWSQWGWVKSPAQCFCIFLSRCLPTCAWLGPDSARPWIHCLSSPQPSHPMFVVARIPSSLQAAILWLSEQWINLVHWSEWMYKSPISQFTKELSQQRASYLKTSPSSSSSSDDLLSP